MAFQTSYRSAIPPALNGMLRTIEVVPFRLSLTVETSDGIGYGVAVRRGTADLSCVVGLTDSDSFVGVTVLSTTQGEDNEYAHRTSAAVLTRGDIWVTVPSAVSAGDDVTAVASTGVMSTAATSSTQIAIDGAVWVTSAAANGLAILRIGG